MSSGGTREATESNPAYDSHKTAEHEPSLTCPAARRMVRWLALPLLLLHACRLVPAAPDALASALALDDGRPLADVAVMFCGHPRAFLDDAVRANVRARALGRLCSVRNDMYVFTSCPTPTVRRPARVGSSPRAIANPRSIAP